MREVDDALRHAFARRDATGATLSSPHWPARTATVPPRPLYDGLGSDERTLLRRMKTETSSTPHRSDLDAVAVAEELPWPDLVIALERHCTDRFESMVDRLIDARDRQGFRVVWFTSCHRAEGRTTLILSLARVLARRTGRTLLVDADLNGPVLSRTLGLMPSAGIDDVIEEDRVLADALINYESEHLWVLPLRSRMGHARKLLSHPGWPRLMTRLRRDFDLVLIDGGPLFNGLNGVILPRSIDAAVLVHCRTMSGDPSLRRAREVLAEGGVPLVGVAETFA